MFRTAVRHASSARRRIPEKISVQLLKDHPTLGVAGEIIKVRPAFMRNYLHAGNKACYLTDGPRLPVVDKPKHKPQRAEPVVEKSVVKETAGENVSAMSLNELSTLFNTMKKSRRASAGEGSQLTLDTTSADGDFYTLNDLKESVASKHTVTLESPITVDTLSDIIFQQSGIRVAASNIQINEGRTEKIDAKGTFNWLVAVPVEKATFTAQLVVV